MKCMRTPFMGDATFPPGIRARRLNRGMAASNVTTRLSALSLIPRRSFLTSMLLVAADVALAQSVPASVAQKKALYARLLQEYQDARAQYEAVAEPYWRSIADKRRGRNDKRRNGEAINLQDYVLVQPPKYTGPPRPVDPFPEPAETPAARPGIPVVADFLRHALEQFHFVPTAPKSEIDYKRAYAQVASKAGITGEQAIRIYAFEAGGNGKYDVQAGLEGSSSSARAISTALGYNQLLTTNTVSILAEKGEAFAHGLAHKAKTDNDAALAKKVVVLRKMVEFTRGVPNQWSEHEKIARTSRGNAVHALNLDIQIGPLLQTQKLLDSVIFAQRKGKPERLSAAELEMMNLTGDGNGFDMISLPTDMRSQVPTSNFFQRGGYERNPVVIRNNTVAALLAATNAKMDRDAGLQGAKDMAAAFGR